MLAKAVEKAREATVVYGEDENLVLPAQRPYESTSITVTTRKSFEAVMSLREKNPKARIMVHNFASATNPGGGVTRGSRAQEECLCRCSTLYPVLHSDALWEKFYAYHRNLHDTRYTDTCIYSPGILVIKTDTDLPERLDRNSWCEVDVVTCAAPNLRKKPYNAMNPGSGTARKMSDEQLLQIHLKRARRMLTVASVNGAEILVLGAFGCGAFQNKPEIVAEAYRQIMKEFDGYFKSEEKLLILSGFAVAVRMGSRIEI